MENLKILAPTMLFRLPVHSYHGDMSTLSLQAGPTPYRLADTLYMSYEQFREAIDINSSIVRSQK